MKKQIIIAILFSVFFGLSWQFADAEYEDIWIWSDGNCSQIPEAYRYDDQKNPCIKANPNCHISLEHCCQANNILGEECNKMSGNTMFVYAKNLNGLTGCYYLSDETKGDFDYSATKFDSIPACNTFLSRLKDYLHITDGSTFHSIVSPNYLLDDTCYMTKKACEAAHQSALARQPMFVYAKNLNGLTGCYYLSDETKGDFDYSWTEFNDIASCNKFLAGLQSRIHFTNGVDSHTSAEISNLLKRICYQTKEDCEKDNGLYKNSNDCYRGVSIKNSQNSCLGSSVWAQNILNNTSIVGGLNIADLQKKVDYVIDTLKLGPFSQCSQANAQPQSLVLPTGNIKMLSVSSFNPPSNQYITLYGNLLKTGISGREDVLFYIYDAKERDTTSNKLIYRVGQKGIGIFQQQAKIAEILKSFPKATEICVKAGIDTKTGIGLLASYKLSSNEVCLPKGSLPIDYCYLGARIKSKGSFAYSGNLTQPFYALMNGRYSGFASLEEAEKYIKDQFDKGVSYKDCPNDQCFLGAAIKAKQAKDSGLIKGPFYVSISQMIVDFNSVKEAQDYIQKRYNNGERFKDCAYQKLAVETLPVSEITKTTAKLSGIIKDFGTTDEVRFWFRWHRQGLEGENAKNISDTKTIKKSEYNDLPLESNITGLQPYTTYCATAYAQNTQGTPAEMASGLPKQCFQTSNCYKGYKIKFTVLGNIAYYSANLLGYDSFWNDPLLVEKSIDAFIAVGKIKNGSQCTVMAQPQSLVLPTGVKVHLLPEKTVSDNSGTVFVGRLDNESTKSYLSGFIIYPENYLKENYEAGYKAVNKGEYSFKISNLFLDKSGYCVKAVVKENGELSTPSEETKCFRR